VPYGPLAMRAGKAARAVRPWTSRWGESRFGRGSRAWQGKELVRGIYAAAGMAMDSSRSLEGVAG